MRLDAYTQEIPGITVFTPSYQLNAPNSPSLGRIPGRERMVLGKIPGSFRLPGNASPVNLGGLGTATGFGIVDSAQNWVAANPLPVLAIIAFLLIKK